MAKSNEPIVWSFFSGGGVMAAFFVPVLILLTGFLAPNEKVELSRMAEIFSQTWVKGAVCLLSAMVFVHAAHRFRFTLVDMGLQSYKTLIMWLCYVSALGAIGYTSWVLFA